MMAWLKKTVSPPRLAVFSLVGLNIKSINTDQGVR